MGIRETFGQQAQHLHFAAGQPGLIRTGRGAWAAWNARPALRSHALTQMRCGRLRAELLEEGQGLPLGGGVSLSEGQGLLIRATNLGPPRGSTLPISCQLQGKRLGSLLWRLS